MAEIISGLRVARSLLTPGGASVVSAELDFQLGARQGIEISAVLGVGAFSDLNPATSDTVLVAGRATSTLHMETGSLEDPGGEAGDDAVDIDTEIFYMQEFQHVVQVPATAGGGGGGIQVSPSGLVTFSEPIRTARNITHRTETFVTGQSLEAFVFIYYHYILFTNSELGFLLARRQ